MTQATLFDLRRRGDAPSRPLPLTVPVGRFKGVTWRAVPVWLLSRTARDRSLSGAAAREELRRRFEAVDGLDDDAREALVREFERQLRVTGFVSGGWRRRRAS